MQIPWRRLIKRTVIVVTLMILLAVMAVLISQEYPVPGEPDTQISRAIGQNIFDFIAWMGEGWIEKASQIAAPAENFLTDEQRSQLVLTFAQKMNDWLDLEWQVRRAYADASIEDPETKTQDLRTQRDSLRAEIEQLRPTAEAILQQQIASVLVDEGLAVGVNFPACGGADYAAAIHPDHLAAR